MPRFFFDVRDQDGTDYDDVGIELPDLDAARREARQTLGDLMRDHIARRGTDAVAIDIRTGEGKTVIEVVAAADERDP